MSELLKRCEIPQSTGYKLVDALVREGLLQRPRRGMLALGPAVGSFFFTPLKALASPAVTGTAVASVALLTGGGGRRMTRTAQWNSNLLDLVSTASYKKDPPFVIGFSNASTSSPWRIALARSLMAAAQRQRDVVSHVLVRDAQDDPMRQIEHLEEMLDRSIDLCILSAAASDHLQLQATVRKMGAKGVPVVGVDRVCGQAEDLLCFVTAPDVLVGRISALWLSEFLVGRGRILMLCGREDASPCRQRLQAALEIFSLYPEIEIEAIEYTNWEAQLGQDAVGRHLKRGADFAGVWCDSGLQGVGSIRAFVEAGFRRGTVPPHTGGEINLMYKLAFQHKVPLCGVDYPASMGALSFQTGLDALFGRKVPRRIEANIDIVVSRGHETPSVKADILAEEKVRWDREDDYIHAAGWIPNMNFHNTRGKPFFI